MSPDIVRLTADWRLYVRGRRRHHGRVGAQLLAAGAAAIALGGLLVWHDWTDRPWPLTDGAIA